MVMKRLLLSLLFLAGCRGDSLPGEAEVVRTTRGDTLVVRTVQGSRWPVPPIWRTTVSVGELDGPPETSFGRVVSIAVLDDGRLLVLDRLVPTIRVFDADGAYIESWGRRGEGPGELDRPDAGMTVLSDGRVVVRDRGNARLQVFLSDGTPSDTWRVITGQYINRRAMGTAGDTLINPDLVNPGDPLPDWRTGLVRIGPEGDVIDTLPIPDLGRRAHRFVARAGANAAEADLPFAPTEHWAWHPDGFVIHGAGDEYALTLYRDPQPLRIEREVTPVPVTPAEREQEELRVLNRMRSLDDSWRWRGPGIPDAKPYFSGIVTGTGGRIWVLRDGDGYEAEDPDYDPGDPYDTEIRWRQDRLADAFEGDGSFLGSVVMPRDLDWRVPPVLRADTMWAVARDDLGVQRVRRYELRFSEDLQARSDAR
jgi:hypothetical protein